MTEKPYNDVETLARLYYTLNEDGTATHQQIADELGCSVGTISIRFNEKYSDKGTKVKEEYSEADFVGDRHKDSLDELGSSDIFRRLESEFYERFETDVKLVEGVAKVPEMETSIVISEGNFSEEIERAYGTRDNNPCVAISEHRLSERVVELFDDEAIGLIVVTEDEIQVVSDCNLTTGSTVKPFLSTPMQEGMLYHSKGWMKLQCNRGRSIKGLAEQMDVRPDTVRQQLDTFGLTL